jgi:hypothetical protein
MHRDGAFGYACHRCMQCCRAKRIRVNPYEVYRLARNLGITTTEFIERHTVNGGTELAIRDDMSCVFLGEDGCTVHADRPLVCRLYPLGRVVQPGMPDEFFRLSPHPQSDGVYDDAGTVSKYLEQQGAGPFMHAADVYLALLNRVGAALEEIEVREAGMHETLENVEAAESSHWLDIDAVLAENDSSALNADEAMTRHVTTLDGWQQELQRYQAPEQARVSTSPSEG